MLKRRVTGFIVIFLAIFFIAYTILTTGSSKVGIEKGMLAPDFSLPLWESGNVTELSAYQGEIVVLNLWASWCPPCRKEMPDFVRLYENYQGRGVAVLGVNLATHERDAVGAAEFMETYQIPFPTFVDQPIDEVNRRGIVSSLYNINSIPYTYILDKNGRIVHIIQGATTYEVLEELVEELL